MTAADSPQDLVRAVVLGELDRDDPRVCAALAADPALRDQLDELLATQALLDAAGEEERAVHGAAAAAVAPPIDAAAILHRLAARPARSGLPRSFWLLAAAAAALLALLWWQMDRSPTPPRDPGAELNDGTEVIGFARDGENLTLRWRGTLRPGDYHRVRVLDAAGAVLLQRERPPGNAWTFPAKTAAGWPNRVIVEIETYDLEGSVRATPLRRAFDLPR